MSYEHLSLMNTSGALIQNEKLSGVSIQDCQMVTIRNCEIDGPVTLNNSNPSIGLTDITLENCYIHGTGSTKPIFAGGYTYSGLKILGCKIEDSFDSTHLIYLSGGHWKGSIGQLPCSNIVIQGCTIQRNPKGRNCIQLNGRFSGVSIVDNVIRHAQLNGIMLIGVQNCKIARNTIYGNNRSCLVIYDYIDGAYWDADNAEDMMLWTQCHHENKNILVENNTMLVGPTQWCVSSTHKDDPQDGHPVVLINNKVEQHKPANIYLRENVIWSPNPNLIDLYNQRDGKSLHLLTNLLWSTSKKPVYVGGLGAPYIAEISGAVYEDPDFERLPEYLTINIDAQPDYDWSVYPSYAKLISDKLIAMGMGVPKCG